MKNVTSDKNHYKSRKQNKDIEESVCESEERPVDIVIQTD
jgi:hypothetical protein